MRWRTSKSDLWSRFKSKTQELDSLLNIYGLSMKKRDDVKILTVSEQIETIWADSKKAILKTFDFFENTLNLKGPQLIPYRYFYLTISNYFYQNSSPDYDFLKKYFWFNSLHRDDLLSNTTDIKNHITFLNKEKNKEEYQFERFLIDRDTLRKASYSSKGVSSRAILALFATNQPKDWKFTDRNVIAENFFFSTDKPNLHHIFPTDYIAKNPGSNTIDNNSLMNIAYLTQITNLEISNKNGINYPNGIVPGSADFPGVALNENFGNLGVLGEKSDPLLDATLNYIATGSKSFSKTNDNFELKEIYGSKLATPAGDNMFVDFK